MIISERARGSLDNDDFIDFSGTATGSVQQLLPQQAGRIVFYFQNLGAASMFLYFGPPPVTVTLTSGVITAVSVADNGSNWTVPPKVVLRGGIYKGYLNASPGSPNTLFGSGIYQGNPGVVVANPLSGGALNGFTIVNGGSNYAVAPTAQLVNDWPLAGAGAGTPSATAGFTVVAGGTLSFEHTFCPTSAVNILGTNTQTWNCKVVLI